MRKLLLIALAPLMVFSAATMMFAEDKPAEGERDKAEGEDKAEEAAEEAPKHATVGKKAPDFTLKNANGEEVKLSDFKGKTVVIEWINVDCPWVRPHYVDDTRKHVNFQQKVRDDGGAWLMICSSAEGQQGHFAGEALTERLKRHGIDLGSYLIDTPGDVARTYQARVTPEMYVICGEGVLQYKGALDNLPAQHRQQAEPVNYIKEVLEALKEGKEIETPERRAYG